MYTFSVNIGESNTFRVSDFKRSLENLADKQKLFLGKGHCENFVGSEKCSEIGGIS